MRILICLLAAATVAFAAPNRQAPPERERVNSGIPQIAGQWNLCGLVCTIEQHDRLLSIGSRAWQGAGFIQADGIVRIDWYQTDGRQSVGFYRLVNPDELAGVWGYADALWYLGTKIEGANGSERLTRTTPGKPP